MARPHRWLLVALLVGGALFAQEKEPRTFAYAKVGGRPLELDFYRSSSTGRAPLVIWIHGGAWRAGSKDRVPGPVRALTRQGFAVASIQYRLTSEQGRWGDAPVYWPAQRDDCKAAIRWLRANARKLDVDAEAFIAWGASAGGHLASIVGLTNDAPGTTGTLGNHEKVSSAVALAINFYGPSDLFKLNEDVTSPPGSVIDHDALGSPESMVLGGKEHGHSLAEIRAHATDKNPPWPSLLARARSCSPIHAVVPEHACPLYTAHGMQDKLIAFAQGQRLHRRLLKLGVPSTFRPVKKAGHGFRPVIFSEAIAWMRAELDRKRTGDKKKGAGPPDERTKRRDKELANVEDRRTRPVY